MKPKRNRDDSMSMPLSQVVHCSALSRRAPGVLVLTSSLHVIYMNASASRMLMRLQQSDPQLFATGVLPVEVTQLCKQVATSREDTRDPKVLEQQERVVVVCARPCPLQLHAFAIPQTETNGGNRLLVILIEEQRPLMEVVPGTGESPIKFSHREESTAQFLMNGLTNKEIGVKLGISEFTVKDHIKRLMKKTRTSTRAGLIARILLMLQGDGRRAILAGEPAPTPFNLLHSSNRRDVFG